MKILLFFVVSSLSLLCNGQKLFYPIPYEDIGSSCDGHGIYRALNECKQESKKEIVRYNDLVGPVVCCHETQLVRVNKKPKAGTRARNACTDESSRAPDSSKKIVRGLPSAIGEFPHMAALGHFDNNNELDFNCGGALISDKFVLTAAHCVTRRGLVPEMARLGRVS